MFQTFPGALEAFRPRPLQTQISGRCLLRQGGNENVLGRTHELQMMGPYSDRDRVIWPQNQIYPLLNSLKDPVCLCLCLSLLASLMLTG